MEIPPEIFEKDLTPAEFRVVASLYHVADGRGVVDVSQEKLGVLTKYKREYIRRCLRSLEELGLVETTRKKRNYGKYHRNVYQLLLVPGYKSPCLQSEASTESSTEKSPCLQSEASTDSYIASKIISKSVINTSYLLQVRDAHGKKEIRVGNWRDEDDVQGVGLFEEEVAQKVQPKKVNKRDPRTRAQRPNHEWTTIDTAAEFADHIRNRFPQLPSLVNTRNLAVVLAKYRKELGTTALVELELMRMCLEDEKNLSYISRHPDKTLGVYLNMFKSRLSDAMERLDMGSITRNTDVQVDTETEFVYASDGARFENTLVGRKALELYSERLQKNS